MSTSFDRDWRRIKEQVEILTGERGANGRPERAVRLRELSGLAAAGVGGGGDITKVSQLENDKGYVNSAQAAAAAPIQEVREGAGVSIDVTDPKRPIVSADLSGLSAVAISGSYNDLTDKPTLGSAAAASASDFVAASAVGAVDGVAPLDSNRLIPAPFLPSYVDDVLEFANVAAFPVVGEKGKIYVAEDSNKTYRWSGSTYIEISASPGSTDAVPEGAVNLYHTAARAAAAAPVQSVNGKTGVFTLTYADVGAQQESASLASLAGMATAADRAPYLTGANAWASYTLTAGGRALAGAAGTANTFPYFSSANVVTLAAITAAGRTLLAGADAAAQRTSLQLGSAALAATGDFQPAAANLTAWAGIVPSSKADTASVIPNGGSIPSGADLNNYTTTGFYNQRSNAGAAAGSNYPVSFAGELIVYADGLMVYQTYRRYGAVYAIFHRNYNNGTWYPWVYDWNSSNFDPAGKANVVHGHAIGEVGGLQAALDGKLSTGGAFADAFSSPPAYYPLNTGFDANSLLPGQKALVSATGNLNLPVVSGIIFWYIECANSYLAGGSQRVQIAYSYSNTPTMCIRNLQGSTWQPWRRLATENDLANIPTQTVGDLLVSKASAIVGVGVSGGRNGGIANYANNGLGDVGVFSEHAGGRVRLRPDGRLSTAGEFVAQVGSFGPTADNTQNVGGPSARVKEFFAGASAINTSDARHKTTVREFTPAEIAAAVALGDELGIYQWLDAVAEKGEDEARLHPGLTVQRAIEVMRAHGLDPMRYGFICYDQWPELPEIRRDWPFEPRVVDDFGNLIREQVDAGFEIVQEHRPAGDLYSFRMSPLLAFIAAGERAARLRDRANMEERISAIEAALGLPSNSSGTAD